MPHDLKEPDPRRLAAILYRPVDDVDSILAGFAFGLLDAGERIGGVVQSNIRDGAQKRMRLTDLGTRREISISQPLGTGATACRLDTAGLAEASLAIARAIERRGSLVIVNKFSRQEAAGHGLREEIARAVMAGLPVLTAVPEKCLMAWRDFTADRGTILFCARHVVEAWWRDLSARDPLLRGAPHGTSAITFRSSHPTI